MTRVIRGAAPGDLTVSEHGSYRFVPLIAP